MPVPPGAVEHYSGYPLIDPATINPELDWPSIDVAQADWISERVTDSVANDAELLVKYSGLSSTDQRLVGVRSDRTLRFWDGTQWLIVARGATVAWTSVAPTWEDGPGTGLSIGNGTHTQRYSRDGRTITMAGKLVRGSTSNFGTSYYRFSLPVTAADYQAGLGTGVIVQTRTSPVGFFETPATLRLISSNRAVLVVATSPAGTAGRLGSTATVAEPTWAAGDMISYSITYEASA